MKSLYLYYCLYSALYFIHTPWIRCVWSFLYSSFIYTLWIMSHQTLVYLYTPWIKSLRTLLLVIQFVCPINVKTDEPNGPSYLYSLNKVSMDSPLSILLEYSLYVHSSLAILLEHSLYALFFMYTPWIKSLCTLLYLYSLNKVSMHSPLCILLE